VSRYRAELFAALLLCVGLAALVLGARYQWVSNPKSESCRHPVEIIAPDGHAALWCNRSTTYLEDLLDRLDLSDCQDKILAAAGGNEMQLTLELSAECALDARPWLSGGAAVLAGAPLDVNRASAVDLQVIRGLGPSLSHEIITFREEHGPFCSVADLVKVKGIGPKRIKQWEKLLTATCPK
jgi:competence ComEA-like helix-hairpin-helix protein